MMKACASRVLLVLIMVGVTAAWAAEPIRPKFGTREQLRECMKEEDSLVARRDAHLSHQDQQKLRLEKLKAEMTELAEAKERMDGRDLRSVDEFNARMTRYNESIAEMNEYAGKLTDENIALNRAVFAQNERCAGLVFRKEDRKAVEQERANAGAKSASPKEDARDAARLSCMAESRAEQAAETRRRIRITRPDLSSEYVEGLVGMAEPLHSKEAERLCTERVKGAK